MRPSRLLIPLILIVPSFTAQAQSAFPQVVLIGKVTQLKPVPRKDTLKEWSATVAVEVVESGDFIEQTLVITINSPSKPMMDIGKRYRIRAEKIKGKYVALSTDIKAIR